MTRYKRALSDLDDRTPEAMALLAELVAVCRKHNRSLGHEDGHGAFIVEPTFTEDCAEWLMAAHEEEST